MMQSPCVMRMTLTAVCALAMLFTPSHAEINGGPAKLHGSAPLFTLVDQNGNNVALTQFSGKFVVLEFMSTDCVFVKRHHKVKTMQALVEKYKEKGVAWVAVNSNRGSDAGRNRAWAREYELSYPILDDGNLSLAKAYKVTRTPTMIIIDRGGNIAYMGAIDDDDSRADRKKEGLRNYVDRALLNDGAEVFVGILKKLFGRIHVEQLHT